MDKAEQNASRADKAIRRFLGPEERPVDPKAALIKGANDLLVLVLN